MDSEPCRMSTTFLSLIHRLVIVHFTVSIYFDVVLFDVINRCFNYDSYC